MEPFDTRERCWLDLLLQHAVPETVARSCIQDAADDAQLIAKIKALASPGEGVERLVQVLSFREAYKRPWLNIFLLHGVPAKHAIAVVDDTTGGLPELNATLRRMVPGGGVEPVIKEVRTCVWRMCRVLFWCACACACACAMFMWVFPFICPKIEPQPCPSFAARFFSRKR